MLTQFLHGSLFPFGLANAVISLSPICEISIQRQANIRNRHRLSLIQIHVAALLAGFTGLFGKFLDVSPATITCGRSAFGCLALACGAALTATSLRLRSGNDLLVLACSGAILAVHWISFFLSIQVSSVAVGLLAFATFPLFVTFLEPFFFRERLRGIDVLTALIVVAGLMLVTPELNLGNRLTQGVLWGILSALAYAVLSLLSRSYVRIYPTLTVTFYQQLIAALCTLPIALFRPSPITPGDILLLLILGVVSRPWRKVCQARNGMVGRN